MVAGFDRVTNGSIYQVAALDYNSCNPSNPLAYFFGYAGYGLAVGPFPVSQTYPQSYLFVEADATNCTAGMKFDATVYDPASVPPPPAPAPSPTISVNASRTPPPLPPPLSPTSPPGPPAPATPPLQAVPTTGNGTSSKLSVGAKAGIAVAAILSALGLGVGGKALKTSMKMEMHCSSVIKIFFLKRGDAPMEKQDDDKQKLSNQKLQSIDVHG